MRRIRSTKIRSTGRRFTTGRALALALLGLLVAGVVVASRDDPGIVGPVTTDQGASNVLRSTVSGGEAYSKTLSEGRDSNGRTGGGAESVAPDQAATAAAPAPPADSGVTSNPVNTGGPVVPGAPRVVRTAILRLEVAKGGFGAAFDRATSIATTNGGFVASSSTESSEGEANRQVRSGQLTIRVPADRFDSARQALSGLGKVDGENISGDDVSGQLVDYDARLRSLTAQEDAMRTILGKTNAVGEVLQVQSNLFAVRQQIEQLSAQRADLDQRAAISTISVSLFEPGIVVKPIPEPKTGLARSFERAVHGAAAVAGGMLVVVGWAVPVMILAGLVWLIARLTRRTPKTA